MSTQNPTATNKTTTTKLQKDSAVLQQIGILPTQTGNEPFIKPPKKSFTKLTSTALQARLRIFQASQRPTPLHGEWFETAYGRCQVEGRLGQRHADLLSAILVSIEGYRPSTDGGVEILIDPYAIRQSLSESHQYSYSQFKLLLKDLATALITLDSPTIKTTGHLIDFYEESKLIRFNPLTKGDRSPFVIKIGKVLAKLIADDYPLFYNPEPLTRLNYGISQAVARYILTHYREPNGGWIIDNIVRQLTGPIKSGTLRIHRMRLHEDAPLLARLGVIVEEDRIHLGEKAVEDISDVENVHDESNGWIDVPQLQLF